MEWNVFIHNINRKEIENYNIFNHGSFREDIVRAAKEYDNKEEFLKYVKSSLMHHFWAKAEYEVIIAPWCGGDREKDAKKIDIYDQVTNNWDIFSEYIWNNRKNLKD